MLRSVPAVMLPAVWLMPPLPALRSTVPVALASSLPDSAMPPAPLAASSVMVPPGEALSAPLTSSAFDDAAKLRSVMLLADNVPLTDSAVSVAKARLPLTASGPRAPMVLPFCAMSSVAAVAVSTGMLSPPVVWTMAPLLINSSVDAFGATVPASAMPTALLLLPALLAWPMRTTVAVMAVRSPSAKSPGAVPRPKLAAPLFGPISTVPPVAVSAPVPVKLMPAADIDNVVPVPALTGASIARLVVVASVMAPFTARGPRALMILAFASRNAPPMPPVLRSVPAVTLPAV